MTGDSRPRFAVLGSFRVDRDGREADLGPRLQRTLLAILVVEAGRVVPTDRLIDLLWRDEPPAAAIASVQAYAAPDGAGASLLASAGFTADHETPQADGRSPLVLLL